MLPSVQHQGITGWLWCHRVSVDCKKGPHEPLQACRHQPPTYSLALQPWEVLQHIQHGLYVAGPGSSSDRPLLDRCCWCRTQCCCHLSQQHTREQLAGEAAEVGCVGQADDVQCRQPLQELLLKPAAARTSQDSSSNSSSRVVWRMPQGQLAVRMEDGTGADVGLL